MSVKASDTEWWRHKVLRNGREKWGKTISQGLRGHVKEFGLWPSDNERP